MAWRSATRRSTHNARTSSPLHKVVTLTIISFAGLLWVAEWILERLTKPCLKLSEADDGFSDLKKCVMNVVVAIKADAEAAKVMKPAEGSFRDPSKDASR